MRIEIPDTTIHALGRADIPNPGRHAGPAEAETTFVSDEDRILVDIRTKNLPSPADGPPPGFERAGPRRHIYFEPSELHCALVTCGGLCPGLNDIIRSIVMGLHHGYGVGRISGIRHGLQGLIPDYGHAVMDLNLENVTGITGLGGSILGSSRGPQPVTAVVDSLARMNIGLLFMIGGDGTLMAAARIADAIGERGLKIGVVGIPKTIDNDIYLVSRSFGFDTAVEVATVAIRGAHNEAEAFPNGIGLIKLMGRHSGFIAATAALAQQDVNFVLIPEVDFDLQGTGGLLMALEKRLEQRGHAVIVVAEGAGQGFMAATDPGRDASGNIRLGDIGPFLKTAIEAHFKARDVPISIKYIDPSYMIRSLPANANDHLFCNFLGRYAVHAGMAGKTKVLIGHWNNHFVHLPMAASAGRRKQIDPAGELWRSVLEATGQGSLINPEAPV